MIQYPAINPVAISLGPIKIHWYGITYLVGFVCGYLLARYRARKPMSGWREDEIGDLVFYVALGVILGGRMGSILFYNFDQFLQDPLMLLRIWEGGMAFHGGLLGVLAAYLFYARATGRTFFQVADFLAPMYPIGLGAGRIGNFINGELWGRVTDVPWGMVFPHVGPEPRHPNQLYQFVCEGIILFLLLWWFSSKPRPRMAVSGMFLLLYGIYRFLIEFVREPDAHLGFVAFDWLTMGQLLSLPMILLGLLLLFLAYRRPVYDSGPQSIHATATAAAGSASADTNVAVDAATGPSLTATDAATAKGATIAREKRKGSSKRKRRKR